MADPASEPSAHPGWQHSLKTRLALWIGVGAALVASIAGLLLYQVAERRALATSEAALQLELRRASIELRALLDGVEVAADTFARTQAGPVDDPAAALALLDASLLAQPLLAGGLLLEHGLDPAAQAQGSRYAKRLSTGLRHSPAEAVAGSAAGDAPSWAGPMFNFEAGGRWTVGFQQPLGHGKEPGRGLLRLDLPLDALNRALTPFREDPRLHGLLLKGDVAVGDSQWLSIGTPPPSNPQLTALLAPLDGAPAGHLQRLGDGRLGLLEPLDEDWRLLVLLDETKALAPLRDTTWRFLAGTLVAILLLALLGNAFARRITQPLVRLGRSTGGLAGDDFALPTDLLLREDEIGQLARALDRADGALREQMARSRQLAREQQKLDSELRIAHDLQQSMLPASRAVEVAEGRLELHAQLRPAKSVGGDFYAFHPREDGMVWFSIGDVSDKGVPAALFMARTVAVLEATARNTDSPALMLARAAPRLAEGNESCMFATALCGLLDPHTGMFELASSGHELPRIVRADGRVEVFAMVTAAPLGIDPEAYGEGQAGMLEPGDSLFCFTDGVTDARDRHGQLFGEERLHAVLARPGRSAAERVTEVLAAVEAFADGAEPADDITVLCLGLVAPAQPVVSALRFSLWPAGLRAMHRAIDECLVRHGIDAEGQSDVRLVLEELLANALDHGGAGDCTVELGFDRATITLRIEDDGTAFDPLAAPPLELDADDLDRPIGGLGIHLVKTLALDAAYRREGERNLLTLVLPRNPP